MIPTLQMLLGLWVFQSHRFTKLPIARKIQPHEILGGGQGAGGLLGKLL